MGVPLFPKDVFIQCDNSGIKHVVDGNSISDTFIKMISVYNDSIDALYNTDFFAASKLLHNRDVLVMHGAQRGVDALSGVGPT